MGLWSEKSVLEIIFYPFFIFVFVASITLLCRRPRRLGQYIHKRAFAHEHSWCIAEFFHRPTYCNISGSVILRGTFCDTCGICVDDTVVQEANKSLPCINLSNTERESHVHVWIKGNLPLDSICSVCQEDCGNEPRLCDFRCAWCHRTVHEKCCQEMNEELCDFGKAHSFIVPSYCLQTAPDNAGLVITKLTPVLHIRDWSPLLVLANRESGNKDGLEILRAFRTYLNPLQVFDLCDEPAEKALRLCSFLPNQQFKVLACGGDGTVGWILNTIEQLKLKVPPLVAILPLGTGNDLSRVLGWGEGHMGDVDVQKILEDVAFAESVKLDRWTVNLSRSNRFRIRRTFKSLRMNNYFSIGCDALVTLNFHKKRQSYPDLLSNRTVNKLFYFNYGAQDTFKKECHHLEKKITLELDGKVVADLPELESVVVLNISSWGAGCEPWGKGEGIPVTKFDDGLLEVFGIYSSFHIAQLQVGLSEPYRIGQGKTVKIVLREGKMPMQCDGEPWEEGKCTVFMSRSGQASMLQRT